MAQGQTVKGQSDSNKGIPLRVDEAGNLYVLLKDGSVIPVEGSVEISNDTGNPIPVNGTVTAQQPTHDNFNANANVQVGNSDVSDINPMPITGSVQATGAELDIQEALTFTSYNLLAAAYSGTTAISNDYLASHVELHFSSAVKRDITVTTDDGTVVFFKEGDTSLNVRVSLDDAGYNANENLTLAISQTTAACSVTGKLVIKRGSVQLSGNPSLGESSANIGKVDINLQNSSTGDAFGRVRTSQPNTQFEVTHQYDLAPLYVGQTADSTGVVTHSIPSAVLTVDAGEKIKHQSHLYVPYQPGKSRLIRMTGVFGSHLTNCIYRMGYFDDDDGILLQRNGAGTIQLVLRSSIIADQTIDQTAWNLDKLDGTGVSGLTLQPTAGIHLVIDFEWLSVGRVRWGFEIGGTTVYVHQFDNANNISFPDAYMRSGSLPVRWEIDNSAGASTDSMKAICASVMSEGGHEPQGLLWSARNSAPVSVAASLTPLLSIRPRATFNSIANHGVMLPDAVYASSDADVMIEVYIAGTVTGTWTKADTTTSPAADGNSHAEFAVSPTLSGGRLVAAFPVAGGGGSAATAAGGRIGNYLIQFMAADGYQLPITICARRLAGAANATSSIQWVEVR